ncbi:MAG: DUF1214 domain-containing protein [Oceanospirillaceae bacterium]|nr:DUF1214 domain-containing protein [Oceanospirillaceae bacterium]
MAARALLRNEQQVADKSSRLDLDVDDDGSVRLCFGPDNPESGPANWIPRGPGKAWFTYFRFYSPTDAYFDRSRALTDIGKR